MQFNKLDTSNELKVYRYGNGLKLIKPNIKIKNHSDSGWYTNHTVSSLLTIPCGIYFEDVNGVIQQLNENNIEQCNLDSISQAIGKSYFSALTSKAASALLKNDSETMKREKIQILEEEIIQKNNDVIYQVLSVKMPWYNSKNKVIGLFGCSITLGKKSLADSLALITKMGFLVPENIFIKNNKMNDVYLSNQQYICAKLLLTGLKIKEIANRMKLSPRTVEHYIDNMKSKFKCHNKTELILKIHEKMKDECSVVNC
ncbi:MAG: helix-turn-helix transcriptional regulator [Gammaproteobacteria bacterium]